jgi:hypothetical protein
LDLSISYPVKPTGGSVWPRQNAPLIAALLEVCGNTRIVESKRRLRDSYRRVGVTSIELIVATMLFIALG